MIDEVYPCFVLFDGGAAHMSAACADLERRCEVTDQPWPWPMQRWSPDGHEHLIGTDPADAEIERLRRIRRQEIFDELPDVIEELKEENRFDIKLFRRLRAMCPSGRPLGPERQPLNVAQRREEGCRNPPCLNATVVDGIQ